MPLEWHSCGDLALLSKKWISGVSLNYSHRNMSPYYEGYCYAIEMKLNNIIATLLRLLPHADEARCVKGWGYSRRHFTLQRGESFQARWTLIMTEQINTSQICFLHEIDRLRACILIYLSWQYFELAGSGLATWLRSASALSCARNIRPKRYQRAWWQS